MKIGTGADIDSFPLTPAVSHLYIARKRRLARLYQPSKSHACLTSETHSAPLEFEKKTEDGEAAIYMDTDNDIDLDNMMKFAFYD